MQAGLADAGRRRGQRAAGDLPEPLTPWAARWPESEVTQVRSARPRYIETVIS